MTKTIFRACAFVLLLLLLLGLASLLFLPKGNTVEDGIQNEALYAFLGEPENSLDAVVVGDSIPLSSFIPAYLWRDQGIPSYVCASTAQKASDSFGLLRTLFRSQSPKVVLYEGDQLYLDLEADDVVSALGEQLFPVFRFHSNWKFVRPQAMLRTPDYTLVSPEKGYHMRKTTESLLTAPEIDLRDSSVEPISPLNRWIFARTLALCRKEGARLILYSAPNATGWSVPRHNALSALAEASGVTYLDGNLDCTDIDWVIDTLDAGEHLNLRGAYTATQWLGSALRTLESLPDRRTDPRYGDWNQALEAFQAMAEDPDQYW